MGASTAGSVKGRKRKQTRDDRRRNKQLRDAAVAEHYQIVVEDFNEADAVEAFHRREMILNCIDPSDGEMIYSIQHLNDLMDTIQPLTDEEYTRIAPHLQRLMGMDVYTAVVHTNDFDPFDDPAYWFDEYESVAI